LIPRILYVAIMQLVLALTVSALFMHFLEVVQPEFTGWGDVFFFCGSDFQFCTCQLSWNLLGVLSIVVCVLWHHAAVAVPGSACKWPIPSQLSSKSARLLSHHMRRTTETVYRICG
jgi:hypothetical protein